METIKNHCECDHEGKLSPGMSGYYDPVTELPYVNHAPGQCKCTNQLAQYKRGKNGPILTLCSNCFTSGDIRL